MGSVSMPRVEFQLRYRDLNRLPPLSVPEGYELRTYQDGDATAWCRIVEGQFASRWTEEIFDEKMLQHEVFHRDGLFFLVHEGIPVATACAWFVPQRYGTDTGTLHMVAVHPDYQGHGLGKIVSLAVMHYHREHGKKDCGLITFSDRFPAVKMYIALGFEPDFTSPQTWEAWNQLLNPPTAS